LLISMIMVTVIIFRYFANRGVMKGAS